MSRIAESWVIFHFPDAKDLEDRLDSIPRKGEIINYNETFYEVFMVMWVWTEKEVWLPMPDTYHAFDAHLYCKKKRFTQDSEEAPFFGDGRDV